MTNQHPITPPPELVQQWCNDDPNYSIASIATRAAQWGADQELEACCEWLSGCGIASPFSCESYSHGLRAARRPKPPSLKEQAYDALDTYIYGEPDPKDKERTYNTIRRALEALPND
jgi:hypothetical protein